MDFEAWKQRCKEHVVGQDELVDKLFRILLRDIQSETDHVIGVVLDGPQGVGKTHTAKSISQASRMPVKELFFGDLLGDNTVHKVRSAFLDWDTADAPLSIIILHDFAELVPATVTLHEQPLILSSIKCYLDRANDGTRRLLILGTCDDIKAVDSSLLEPGRFEHHLPVQISGWEQRLALLRHFTGRSDGLEVEARMIPGFSANDICELVKHKDIRTAIEAKAIRPSIMATANTDIPIRRTDDLVGMDDVIRECQDLLSISISPRFLAFDVKPPKGILLYGPSGCGKTHLAMALARQSGLNYHYIEASQLRSKYVGQSEKQIAATFAMARQAAPCILLIDHIQNIVPPRRAGQLGASVFRIVSTFLTEMDGVNTEAEKYPVTVIGMAEGKEGIDEAILRPGRLEYHFELPSRLATGDRREFLRRRIPQGRLALSETEMAKLLERTDGFGGAEMEYLWREAVTLRLRRPISDDYADAIVDWSDIGDAVEAICRRVRSK